jgi:single-strand DNA-binding protein
MNLNKVYLIGRLTADPESRTTQSGQTVTNLRMATNRVWTDSSGQKNESPEYHTVVAWARLAEIASQYLKRGSLLMIEGRLQTRSWEAQDGSKRYRTEIVAETLQLGPRSSQSNNNDFAAPPQDDAQPPQNNEPETPEAQEDIPVINEDESGINPEDIPF